VEDVEAPEWASGVAPQAGFSDSIDVSTNPTSATTSAATPSVTDGIQQSGSGYRIVDNPSTSDEAITFVFNSETLKMSGGRQIILIVQGTIDEFLAKCKLETGDGSTTETFYDPSSTYINYVRFDGSQDQFDYSLLAFDIPDTGRDDDRIIITTTEDLSVDFDVDFKAIAVGGRVPGNSQYAVSYYNQGSKTESPGVVMRPASESGMQVNAWLERTVDRGEDYTVVSQQYGFKVPVLRDVYYEFSIPTQNPSSIEIDRGVQTLNIYRSDAASENFYYVGNEVLTDYGPPWAAVNGSAGAKTGTSWTDLVPTAYRNFGRVSPTAFNQAFPTSVNAIYGNNRVYAGAYKDDSAEAPTTVFVSEQDQPMRFSQIADFDETEINFRTAFSADTGEPIRAFVDTSASVVGTSSVYCLTDRSVFALSDWNIRRLASNGCVGPNAVCSYDQQVFFVDEELVVRTMQGSIGQISRATVHDKLTAAVAPDKITMAAFGDRVYVSYQDDSESTSGNRVLVWNRLLDAWESDDTTATGKTAAQFLPFRYQGDTRLLFCADDAKVLRYEDSGSTDLDGAAIPFEIRTGELKGDLFREVTLGQVGILADDTTGTLDVTRTVRARGTTTSHASTISLDSTNTTNWREDDSHRALDGFSGDFKLSANLSSGLTLRAVYARVDGGGYGAD
jgi:hypothetical protein